MPVQMTELTFLKHLANYDPRERISAAYPKKIVYSMSFFVLSSIGRRTEGDRNCTKCLGGKSRWRLRLCCFRNLLETSI